MRLVNWGIVLHPGAEGQNEACELGKSPDIQVMKNKKLVSLVNLVQLLRDFHLFKEFISFLLPQFNPKKPDCILFFSPAVFIENQLSA
ncbi:hypothetical protein CU633_19515 [Bacillus sp. V3-13]|nr:hypothetical protein CU633_19515 [Bacillus sp. V3-13]